MIGTIIKNARISANMKQAELADRIDISRHALYRLENGKVSRINSATLLKIESALSIPSGLLFCSK